MIGMNINNFKIIKGLKRYKVVDIKRENIPEIRCYKYIGKVYKSGRAYDGYNYGQEYLFNFEIKVPNIGKLHNKLYKII